MPPWREPVRGGYLEPHHLALSGIEQLRAISIGPLTMPVDAAVACSALSSAIGAHLPPATALATMDLKVNYLRPLAADGRPALGRGVAQHVGRRIAVAGAEVLDADGKTVAIATGSAMVLPGRPASLGTFEE